ERPGREDRLTVGVFGHPARTRRSHVADRRDPPGLPAALPPDPDDGGGRDARGPSARVRSRHGLGAAPAARLRHGRRSRAEPALDALHHARGLSLSRPRPGLAQRRQGAYATRARAAARGCGGGRAKAPARTLSTNAQGANTVLTPPPPLCGG